jgi:hypothetical protein
MQNIKLHDADNQLILIDCSAPEFDDAEFNALGITRELMMNRLHAQDANGQWLVGVAAFEVIYQTVGMASIAKLWVAPSLGLGQNGFTLGSLNTVTGCQRSACQNCLSCGANMWHEKQSGVVGGVVKGAVVCKRKLKPCQQLIT